jgi:soluble lytic murein transglycosylase-like protein
VGAGLILLAIAMGFSLLADTKRVANPRETSSGLSEGFERQNPLVEPALRRAIKNIEANREKVPTELALPSGSPEGLPQTTPQAAAEADSAAKVYAAGLGSGQLSPNLADGVTSQEEINLLVELYAAKYGVDAWTLREIARCESTDNPWGTGKSGERGLTQFLKSTWETTPLKVFGWEAAYHPAVNLEAAAWMLAEGRVGEFHAIPCFR